MKKNGIALLFNEDNKFIKIKTVRNGVIDMKRGLNGRNVLVVIPPKGVD